MVTVKQLIQKLKEYDGDAIVTIDAYNEMARQKVI